MLSRCVMNYTTTIPAFLVEQTRTTAAKRGITASDIVTEALARYFGINASGPVVKATLKAAELMENDGSDPAALMESLTGREGG